MALATVCLAALALSGEELVLARTELHLADPATRLALRDVDGDGDRDLILIDDAGVHARRLSAEGTYSPADDAFVAWTADDLAWTLADLDGDGRTVLVAHVGGREVRAWRLDGGPDRDAPLLAFEGSLPRGRFELRFCRDVDGDGRQDLVLPAFGRFAVHLREDDGTWAAPLEVQLTTEIDLDVGDPRALDASFGQDVSIPWVTLEDVDGDGDVDLVAEGEDAVHFHLAEPALSSTPTWTLDLAALRAELPPEGELDTSNLLGEAARTVEWELADLDGEPPHDLLVQTGRKFRVYRGASRTGPAEIVPQVLKASGNVLLYLLRDVEGDALPELQILRAQELSLATVVRWLVLPGSFDFELFTYRNEGGTFSRRPTRRNALALEMPRLLAFVKEVQELEERLEASEEVPARRAALDADGVANDVLDLDGARLLVFRDRAPEADGDEEREVDDFREGLEELLRKEVDGLADGENRSFDLRELVRDEMTPGTSLRDALAGVEPDQVLELGTALEDGSVHTRDLDGDGRADVLVVGRDAEGAHVVHLLVRR